jgi:NTP pyrophosphatase (non-canonical NTP hydrolase)
MALKSVQKQVDDWVSQYKLGYFKPLEILARLTEEVGEVAREVNHMFGPKKKKPSEDTNDLGDEMADIIFTLCCMANSLGIDLDKSFKRVLDKYNGRDKNRWEKKQ